ncbi:MAG: phosphopantetheine-binding protein [Chloroflexota bacterium]
MDIELKFRESLLPVFGLESIDDVLPERSLVNDIGADSLDFVEIIYVIEQNFGVALKTGQILTGGEYVSPEQMFPDGVLSQEGYSIICNRFPAKASVISPGASRIDVLRTITVGDIVRVIEQRLKEAENA